MHTRRLWEGRIIRTALGNTLGLKPNQLRRIEKLYTRRIPPKEIVTGEFARQLSELSFETRRQIGVLIDRQGRVQYVMVGDNRRIELPDFKRVRVATGRFRGLRCIHTHLRGEPLTQDDLTDLALLRLDLMASIDVDEQTGLPGAVRAAHLLPLDSRKLGGAGNVKAYEFLEPKIASQLDLDFLSLIDSLESEMARNRRVTRTSGVRDRTILVGVAIDSLSDAEESMAELAELATSAGVMVQDKIVQRRTAIDPRTVLGKGKLEELLIRALQLGADMLVFDRELTPGQVRSISEATDLKVLDRSQLILDIFAQRAQSREGKIQVELAQLKYLLPRLVLGHDSAFSRLAGGIGGRGPGETKLETDRRRVRDRINKLEKEIENQRHRRQERRKGRTRHGLPVISIVGYTNAGKSTLLNTLTKSTVHAEQRMFATLDPTSRRLRLPREQEVIINDTVGFIRDLPPDLLSAFRATLEEISDSSLLVHVIDVSNPRWLQQVASVKRILGDLQLHEIPAVLALNKVDLLDPEALDSAVRQARQLDAGTLVAVSATKADSLGPLLQQLRAVLTPHFFKTRRETHRSTVASRNA
ncbi:MAG: GTPase HflX [Pyrinomonadaceae bacterium]